VIILKVRKIFKRIEKWYQRGDWITVEKTDEKLVLTKENKYKIIATLKEKSMNEFSRPVFYILIEHLGGWFDHEEHRFYYQYGLKRRYINAEIRREGHELEIKYKLYKECFDYDNFIYNKKRLKDFERKIIDEVHNYLLKELQKNKNDRLYIITNQVDDGFDKMFSN
jgi:hypothetical protein